MKSMFSQRMRKIPFAGLLMSILLAAGTQALADDQVSSNQLATGQNQSDRSKILAGYFEEWSIYGANYNVADVQNSGIANKISHLIYAFANVSANGQCAIADSWADYQDPSLPSVNGQPYTGPLYGNFAALLQLKQLHPNLRIMISVGGASAANAANFSYAASTPALRSQFVASCIDMFISGNVAQGVSAAGLFDGIDLDWEFPAAADKHHFTLLLHEFRQQLNAIEAPLHRHYLLSMFAPAGSQNYSNIELPEGAPLPRLL